MTPAAPAGTQPAAGPTDAAAAPTDAAAGPTDRAADPADPAADPADPAADPATPAPWQGPGARHRLAILQRSRSVAIVGASANPARASYFVATYLLSTSPYRVWFVNPNSIEILGHPVYPSLQSLPETPDIVDVFRRHEELPHVLDDVIAVGAPVMWMQLGLWDEDVARRGQQAGVEVVMNRCLKIEHARFHGGLHLAGFDTGVISSRRRPT
jgi:uncharacterized protein